MAIQNVERRFVKFSNLILKFIFKNKSTFYIYTSHSITTNFMNATVMTIACNKLLEDALQAEGEHFSLNLLCQIVLIPHCSLQTLQRFSVSLQLMQHHYGDYTRSNVRCIKWSAADLKTLERAVEELGYDWERIAADNFKGRNPNTIKCKYLYLKRQAREVQERTPCKK